MELSKYQTLPGKLKSKKREVRVELNGDDDDAFPVHGHGHDYRLSEFL